MLANTAAVQAAATGYQALFDVGRSAVATFWGDYMETMTSDGHAEVYQISPLGVTIREWSGDRRIQTEKVFSYTITNQDWEATISIPRNTWEDDKLGTFNSKFEQMGMEAEKHPDELLASLLANGFTTPGYDGVAFFSNSHVTKDGANNRDNLVSGALTAARFQEAYQLLEGMKAYNGKPLGALRLGQGVDLIVPPALRATAEAIVSAQMVESTGGGAVSNVNYNRARLVVNPYLSSSTGWYLAVRGARVRPFMLQMRRRAELVVMSSPNDQGIFYQKEIIIGLDGRWSSGYGHPELIVGSLGT